MCVSNLLIGKPAEASEGLEFKDDREAIVSPSVVPLNGDWGDCFRQSAQFSAEADGVG